MGLRGMKGFGWARPPMLDLDLLPETDWKQDAAQQRPLSQSESHRMLHPQQQYREQRRSVGASATAKRKFHLPHSSKLPRDPQVEHGSVPAWTQASSSVMPCGQGLGVPRLLGALDKTKCLPLRFVTYGHYRAPAAGRWRVPQ